MPTDLMIDILLVTLLGVAIYGAYRLNRNLGVIRHGQEELTGLVAQLNEATGRAQTSIQELKRTGSGIEESLHSEIGRARALADELSLITEAGDSLADRLEKRLNGLSAATTATRPLGQLAAVGMVSGSIGERLANDTLEGLASGSSLPTATEETIFAALKEAR